MTTTNWTRAIVRDTEKAIPPAWGLEATVAVNPFVGQANTGLAETAALLARVGGGAILPERRVFRAARAEGRMSDVDMVDALLAAGAPVDLEALKDRLGRDRTEPQSLPTVADLVMAGTGTDWPTMFADRIGAFAGALFDRGQALWAQPRRETVWETWQGWARRDLTPEIQGLSGFAAFVAALPRSAEAARDELASRLGITPEAAPTAFHRWMMDLGGWSQYARHLGFEAEKHGNRDETLADLLAIRMAFDAALLEQSGVAPEWQKTVAAHAEPVQPSGDQIIDAILQDAMDRGAARRLSETLAADGRVATGERPRLQAAFCIDVRSEVFRRALEAQEPNIETIGFAGFFGLGVSHKGFGSDVCEPRLPVLLTPGITTTSAGGEDDAAARYAHRARRAWGRFKLAAVSSFAFVEASGPLYGAKLLKDALGAGLSHSYGPAPRLSPELDAEARIDAAETVLKAMSLTDNFARIVMLAGHGAHVTNNPHESALHCGACGGHAGDVNARLLAGLLNDDIVKRGLRKRGIAIPSDTHFVAAMHETTTDNVVLFSEDHHSPAHADDLAWLRATLAETGAETRAERAGRLPRAARAEDVAGRANDWSETRAEWGLAGCSAFIAAPRARTAGRDLSGRAFLHNYDWRADDGFGVLELILTAPVVVASWISLQYYGSTTAPQAFGGGNKVLHNVVGGIGVVEGNGGRLRAGLPLQSIHDGEGFAHEPLRLSVAIEAPREAMSDILSRHPGVAQLFDNGWLTLFAMDGAGRLAWRYLPGGDWKKVDPAHTDDTPELDQAIAAE